MPDLPKLRVMLPGRAPADGDDGVDTGIEQALAQNAEADHAGSAEEEDAHGCILARAAV